MAYANMRSSLVNRLVDVAKTPQMDRLARSIPHEAGIEVIGHFFRIGAAKAAIQGYSLHELQASLYQPDSFRQLANITAEYNKSARRIEMSLGLTDSSYTDTIDGFELSDKGLVINRFPMLRYMTRLELLDEGHLDQTAAFDMDDSSRCLGHTSGINTYAYKYMLDICVKDPSLFPATLSSATDLIS
jgi:hypothetical protein